MLVADAVERMHAGRSGMYDVRVSTEDGELVAEFRGHTRTHPARREAEARRRDRWQASTRSKPRRATRSSRCNASGSPGRCAMPTTTWRITEPRSTRPACIPTISAQLADLAKFPFTTKQDLRDNYPFGMFAVPREQLVRVHASSGTTGKPTVVGYTREGSSRSGRR